MSYVTGLQYTVTIAPEGGNIYLGAEVTYVEEGKEKVEVCSTSRLRQKDILDSLNRGGFLYRGESVVGTLDGSCPLFTTEERPSEVDTLNLDELAKTNQSRLLNIANYLQKKYKFEPTLIEKYRVQFLYKEEETTEQAVPVQEQTTDVAVDSLKNLAIQSGEQAGYNVSQLKGSEQPQSEPVAQAVAQEPVKEQPVAQPVQEQPKQVEPTVAISSDITTVDSTQQTVRQPKAIQLNIEDNWVQPQPLGQPEFFDVNPLTDPTFKFKIEGNFPFPIVLNTGELEQFALRTKQRNPVKRNRQYILDHYGVELITDGATYRQFLRDYIEGKIPTTDNRYWMNLNLFVHHSLLHVKFEDFFNDELLQEYINVKPNRFRPEHIEKMREMIRLFPSPLISEKAILHLDDLIRLTAGNYYGLEPFALGLQYFLEDPIEGFNHATTSTGMRVSCHLKLPALTEANDVKTSNEVVTILDRGYNPFEGISANLSLIEEDNGVAFIKVQKVKASVRWEFDGEEKASVVLNSNGSWTFVTRKPEEASGRMVTNKALSPRVYFKVISTIDGYTDLGLPHNGLYKGLTEEQVIQLNRLTNKINKMTNVEMNFTEFHGLERTSVGPSVIRRYVNGMSPSSAKEAPKDDDEVITTITSSGLGEVPLQDLVKTDFESLFTKMYRDVGAPHDIIKLMLMLKHGDVTTSNLTLQIVALANLNKSYKLTELLKVALQNQLITVEEASEVIDRATKTKEPISFNTPLTMDWAVDPTFLDDAVMEVTDSNFHRRLTNTGIGVANVIGIATDDKGNDLGVIFQYSPSKLKADEGEHIIAIETFVRLKMLALHGNITFLNGFVLNDGFINFEGKTGTFERINLASVAHLSPLEFGHLFHNASYEKYSNEYLQPAFQQQAVALAQQGKELNADNFVFPEMTPFQMYFGIPYSEYLTMLDKSEWMLSIQYYNYMEGRPCLATEEIEAYLGKGPRPQVDLPKEVTEPVVQTASTPKPDPVQQAPLTEELPQSVPTAPVAQNLVYGIDEGIEFIDGYSVEKKPELSIEIQKVIYPHLEGETNFNINSSPVGIVGTVSKDGSVSSTVKVSLPTLYRLLSKQGIKVTNAKVAPNAVLSKDLRVGVLDNDYFGLKTLSNDERVDGIRHFDNLFIKNRESARFDGVPFVMPLTPYNAGLAEHNKQTVIEQDAKVEPPVPTQEQTPVQKELAKAHEAPLTEQKELTVLDQYVMASESLQSYYNNVWGTVEPTLKYLYIHNGILKTQGIKDGKPVVFSNSVDVLEKENIRRQLGIIPYEEGGFLVKTISGRLIILTSEFVEI